MVAPEDPSIERDSASKKKGAVCQAEPGAPTADARNEKQVSAMPSNAGIEAPISPVLETLQLLQVLPLSAAFAAALAKLQDYEGRIFNHLNKHFKNKVELATAELRPIAGGSPDSDGKHSLTERAPETWSDWGRSVRAAQGDDFLKVSGSAIWCGASNPLQWCWTIARPFPSSGLLTQSAPQSYCTTAKLCGYQDVRLRNEDRHGLQEGHFEA